MRAFPYTRVTAREGRVRMDEMLFPRDVLRASVRTLGHLGGMSTSGM
jgi:hypothetical protein